MLKPSHSMRLRNRRRHIVLVSLTMVLALSVAGLATAQSEKGGRPEVARSDKSVGLEQLLVGRGYLGIQFAELTPELREHFGAQKDVGVLVSRVVAGGPAAIAGVQVGDIVLDLDGRAIDSGLTLGREVSRHAAGEVAQIQVLRGNSRTTLRVVFEEREPSVISVRPQINGQLRLLSPRSLAAGGDGVEVDVDDALAVLEGFLGSGEWQEVLSSFEGMSLGQVHERMQEVEKQLRELEQRLAEPKDP
jgi:membrane-associated protease RseP (regulator of RpoE activity)